MAFDSARNQTVLFGGRTEDNLASNETWIWDGSNWSKRNPTSSPPPRFSQNMVYDSARGVIVLFGGAAGRSDLPGTIRGRFNDTWTWDGTTWTKLNPQTSPPALSFASMAYDSARGQAVIFGGSTPSSSDTWTWDGSNWTKRTLSVSPDYSAYTSAMAFDQIANHVLLFGGKINAGKRETWAWDGSNWAQKAPRTSPIPLLGGSAVYDSIHREIVMFGKFFTGETVAYTWTWDGSNWTSKTPQASPTERDMFAMAYDSNRGETVLFGGEYQPTFNTTAKLGDTWVWTGGDVQPGAPQIRAVVSASAFGGSTAVSPGTWIEIYGSNLAGTSRSWTGADFNGANAPNLLDGVQVTIGGQRAFIDYVSPGQVNAQLPSGIAAGQQPVVLTNGSTTSAAVNVTVNATQPGLLAPASFQVAGKQYMGALVADGSSFILPPGSIPGLASRRARVGETIILYGIGFGNVTPNIPAGQIVAGSNQLSLPLRILFGGTQARVDYFGLAPNAVGLYQFNVVVPSVPANDAVPVTFTLDGTGGAQVLYTSVQ